MVSVCLEEMFYFSAGFRTFILFTFSSFFCLPIMFWSGDRMELTHEGAGKKLVSFQHWLLCEI